MQGLLHVHSENSLKESPVRIPDLCKKAADLGYQAVALTDHCSMTGIAEFVNTAGKYGLKAVPGLELDIDIPECGIRQLVFIAKNNTGYTGICKAVSEANRNLVDGMPVLPYQKLESLFCQGARFHGSVYVTTAGKRGVLFDLAASGITRQARKQEYQEKIRSFGSLDTEIEKTETKIKKLNLEIPHLQQKKKLLSARTGKNFSKKEEALEQLKGNKENYEEAWRKLQDEKNDCLLAEKELASIQAKTARRKKSIAELEQKLAGQRRKLEQRQKLEEEYQEFQDTSIDAKRQIKDRIQAFQTLFGKDYFFIELMFHGEEAEAEAMPLLAETAAETGTKTVISNDSYILNGTEEDVLRWQILKTLQDNEWIEMEDSAAMYSVKSEQQLRDMLFGFLPEQVIEDSFLAMQELFEQCSFSFPDTKHYPKYQDQQNRPPEVVLEAKIRENIPKLFRDGEWTEKYEERLKEELPVIQKTGYSDYTLIISEILEEGRKGKHDGAPGSFIGPGRGSGAGSLVNYVMGITHIDPLKYGLIFERYLNIERISPPDIDSDIATSIRDLLVHYITVKYSRQEEKVGVCTIETKQRLTAKAAIKAAGRALSSKWYGSAAKLYTVADRISKAVPNELHMTLDKCMQQLLAQFQDDTEREIIRYAQLIEGVMSGYGTHAAGMIITDNGDVTEYAPVMNMGTNEEPVWNIQFDKEESEGIGLLKLDALGLTSLDTISNTMQRIYRTTGRLVDIDRIPFEKKVFREIYGKGKTNGVFQCESPGMKRMWMQLKPDGIEDIIAGVALYRPGPMDFIDDYIKGKQNPDQITYLTPELKPILENTYGCIVYQEQVMRIVRDLAGFSMGRSDLVRRAMSKKKDAIMNAERKNFVYGSEKEGIAGCIARGISEKAANKVYDLMIDFAKYAFNKSHAAAYAVVSYQTAWLKYHYPKEFLIEVMNLEKPENIPIFVEECKKYRYKVLCPDINRSVEGFTEYKGNIIYGLGKVKGVKNNATSIIQNRGSGYKGFADYLLRSGANKTVTKALIQGGAFSSFCSSRTGLLSVYEGMMKKAARYKQLKKRAEEKREMLKLVSSEKKQKRLRDGIARDEQEAEQLKEKLYQMPMPGNTEDKLEDVLCMEQESLYTYITAHPMDKYPDIVSSYEILNLLQAGERCDVRLSGVVLDFQKYLTKGKKKEMCVFSLEDRTAKIKTVCWPEQYEKYKDILKNGMVVKIYGEVREDARDTDNLVLFPKYIGLPVVRKKQTFLFTETLDKWADAIKPQAEQYKEKQGSRAYVYCQETGEIFDSGFYVNEEILTSGLNCTLAANFLPEANPG